MRRLEGYSCLLNKGFIRVFLRFEKWLSPGRNFTGIPNLWKASDSGVEIFYAFTVLPFGLSTAPYVFAKLLKPLEKHWRLQGICIAIFLDDGWDRQD